MKNDLFTIGSITIHGYGLMIGIGIIAAYYLAEYRANKRGMDVDMILSIAICGVVCGILGAKLLYYVTIFDEILANPKKLLDISDGFVVYGGIIGGVLGGYVLSRIKHISFFQYADLVMPSVALAQGFGRIGCFLAGCCYGMPTHSHFAIVFHDSDFAPNNIPLVPTQLISSGLDFLHCLLLLYAGEKVQKTGAGGITVSDLLQSGTLRVGIFRGDLNRGAVGSLSTSQFISLFIFAAGVAMFAFCGKRTEVPLEK